MTYRCLIVDDEDLARELIKRHLSQLDEFEVVASCATAIEARKVLQKEQVDLMFLDIEMPLLKGTDFLRNLMQRPKVIFTTAYRDYALDGFELNAVDYLLKPITFERFFKATEKFLDLQNTNEELPAQLIKEDVKQEFIFVRKDRKQVKVLLDKVLYIESLKDYIRIYLLDETHTIKYGLSAFFELLPPHFLRIHRSYIVNTDKVSAYSRHDVEIGDHPIPIGESYKEAVVLHFKKHLS